MLNSNIDEGIALFVCNGLVDLIQHLEAFDDFAEYSRLAIEEVCFLSERDNELRTRDADVRIMYRGNRSHADCPLFEMLQLGVEEGREGPLRRVARNVAPY